MTLVVTRKGGFIGEVLARLIADDGRWDGCAWLREPPSDPGAARQAIVDAIGLRHPLHQNGATADSAEQALHACAAGVVLVVELIGRCPSGLGELLVDLRQHAEHVEVGIIVATGNPLPTALALAGSRATPLDTAGIARAEARQMGADDDLIDRVLRLIRGREAALHDLAASERWSAELIEFVASGAHTSRSFLRRVTGLLLNECGADEREALEVAVRTGYWHPRFSAGAVQSEALRPWVVPLEHDWGWVRPVWRRPLAAQLSIRRTFRPSIRTSTGPPPTPARETWQPVLDASLLGTFEIRIDGQLVEGLSSQLSSRLLRYLLVRPARSCPRDELIEAFWPESDPNQSRNRLQVALSSLRKVMRAATRLDVVEFADGGYRINPELDVRIDAVEFERLAAVALRAMGGRVKWCEQALLAEGGGNRQPAAYSLARRTMPSKGPNHHGSWVEWDFRSLLPQSLSATAEPERRTRG
jgi:hypothetical protein